MNTIDALRQVLVYACDYLDTLPGSADHEPNIVAVRDILETYEALAPDWGDAPESVNFFTIDPDGIALWHGKMPVADTTAAGWRSGTGFLCYKIRLPVGIDWRLCIWQRHTEAQHEAATE